MPGGRADLKFAFTGAELADGYVLMSVDARMVGPASLKLLSYGMAELHTVDATRTLCGPHYAQEAPQNVKESSPCGL